MTTELRRAEKTSFIIARETDSTGSPVTDRAQAVQRRYVCTSWSHDENSEKQQSDALRGGRADAFSEDGFLWGDGDIEIEIPSEKGFLDIIQGVLADPNPVSVAIPDKVLVAAGTNLSAIVAANYFKDTTHQTIDAVDGQNLADTSVDVVDGQNLSGAGDKTLANNLSAYPEALTVTITPGGTPTLVDTNTPGTVVITYTDANGNTRTTTRSFPNASKTTAQTTALPAGSTITRVRTTGWNAGTLDITTLVATKTLANNLGGYASALVLTVAPNASTTLTNTGTPGTVVIAYTEADGDAKSVTLSFPDASKTVAQTTTLPAGSTITRVHATGFSGGTVDISTPIAADLVRNPNPEYPGQLRFAFSAENAGGSVIVSGVRKVGLASNDTLPLKETFKLSEAGSETTDVTLTKYFYRINTVEVKDSNGDAVTTGTVKVTSVPGGYKTTLKTVNDEFPGWTMEPEIGGEPWLVTKAIPIGAEIEIGENIRATIDILSNRVDKRRTLEGGDEEQFTPTAVQHPSEFPFVGRRFFSGYGRFLQINGEAVICDSAPVSVSHNYDFTQGKVPSRFRRATEPTARRNVTSAVQTKYESGTSEEDIFIKWDSKFRDNEPVDAKIVCFQWQGSGRQLSIEFRMKYCEIQSPVRVAATGPGSIPITVDLKGLPSPGEVDGELTVTIISDDRWV